MLRPKLNRIWTSSNSALRRDPGDSKYLQGWISEIPTFQVFNYLQYKVDTTLLAIAERGIPEWGSDVSYTNGSVAWDESDKGIYMCTVSSPDKTKSPKNNSAQWVKSSIQVSRNEYDAITGKINAHIADVTGNPHKLTAGRIGAYNKAEIDALVKQYKALVSDHVNDKNNPHKTKAVDVGAVPVTGGTYTGSVLFSGGQVWLDAAKTKALSSNNGTSLKNGKTLMYVGDSGAFISSESGVNYQIITDQTFADQKAKVEPQYSVPEPFTKFVFRNNLNIQIGEGYTYVLNGYRYSMQRPGALVVDTGNTSNLGFKLINSQPTYPNDASHVTIMAKFAFDQSYGSSAWGTTFGFDQFHIYVTADGIVGIEDRVNTVYCKAPNKLEVGRDYTIVAVRDGKTAQLYLDGVRVADAAGLKDITFSGSESTVINCSSNVGPVYNYMQIVMWDVSLTTKQVSTL